MRAFAVSATLLCFHCGYLVAQEPSPSVGGPALIAVTVNGQVAKAGTYFLSAGATVSDAINAAGGETKYGGLHRIWLYHRTPPFKAKRIDLIKESASGSKPTLLRNKDNLEVPYWDPEGFNL